MCVRNKCFSRQSRLVLDYSFTFTHLHRASYIYIWQYVFLSVRALYEALNQLDKRGIIKFCSNEAALRINWLRGLNGHAHHALATPAIRWNYLVDCVRVNRVVEAGVQVVEEIDHLKGRWACGYRREANDVREVNCDFAEFLGIDWHTEFQLFGDRAESKLDCRPSSLICSQKMLGHFPTRLLILREWWEHRSITSTII